MTKMFHVCDTSLSKAGLNVLDNQLVEKVKTKTGLSCRGDQLLFDLTVSHMVMGRQPLLPFADEPTRQQVLSSRLPDIYPLLSTVGVFERNVYNLEHFFRKFSSLSLSGLRVRMQTQINIVHKSIIDSVAAVKKDAPCGYMNMAVFCLNMPFIKSNASQLEARLLANTFGVAVAHAKQLYGVRIFPSLRSVLIHRQMVG